MNDYTEEEQMIMRERAHKDNFIIVVKVRDRQDDVYYIDRKTRKDVGYGFMAKEGNGKIYLERCPACEQENFSANVASGFCTWCPFNANGENS